MKLTCDLCQQPLQVNPGGQGATCTCCGLTYSMERLREKLQEKTNTQANVPQPQKPVAETPAPQPKPQVYPVPDWEPVDLPVPKAATAAPREEETPKTLPVADWEEETPPVADWEEEKEQTEEERIFTPQQFVMTVSYGRGDLNGTVVQGGIGVGDSVYVDCDYTSPYRVCQIDGGADYSAKTGARVELYLADCPKRVRKNARQVTGELTPKLNSYNYPGEPRGYFQYILDSFFPEYEVQLQVTRPELKLPINFLLLKNGVPRIALFLIHSDDGPARTQVRHATNFLAGEGVEAVHFYINYRNEAPYVVSKIKGAK